MGSVHSMGSLPADPSQDGSVCSGLLGHSEELSPFKSPLPITPKHHVSCSKTGPLKSTAVTSFSLVSRWRLPEAGLLYGLSRLAASTLPEILCSPPLLTADGCMFSVSISDSLSLGFKLV